jgi:hypothetical protein
VEQDRKQVQLEGLQTREQGRKSKQPRQEALLEARQAQQQHQLMQ